MSNEEKFNRITSIVSECEEATKYMRNRSNIRHWEMASYQEIRDLLGLKIERFYSLSEMKN